MKMLTVSFYLTSYRYRFCQVTWKPTKKGGETETLLSENPKCKRLDRGISFKTKYIVFPNNGIIDFWQNCFNAAQSEIYRNSGGVNQEWSIHSIITTWASFLKLTRNSVWSSTSAVRNSRTHRKKCRYSFTRWWLHHRFLFWQPEIQTSFMFTFNL